jgi:hypothetical protein
VTTLLRKGGRALKESEIQNKVTEHATYAGLVPIRLNVAGRKGWPDYGYGYMGRMCFIEFKKPGEKPTPLQEYVHGQLRLAQFEVYVIDDIEYGRETLNNWKRMVEHEDH